METWFREIRYLGIDFKICKLAKKKGRMNCPSFAYIYIKNSWSKRLKRKIELFMVLFLLMGAIIASWQLSQLTAGVISEKNKTSKEAKTDIVIVIDPGHGGEDPGKVGSNDVLEKDLNLQIAQKVAAMLEEAGIEIVMTREDDNVPTAKKQDLEERVELINDTNPTLALCIHQNSYPDASIHGAQVFYQTTVEEAKRAASIVQEELLAIDSTNKRQIKANDTYYMLKNVHVPTIIVECGFLTNAEEAGRLVQEDYQNKLAEAICEGVVRWLNDSSKGEEPGKVATENAG